MFEIKTNGNFSKTTDFLKKMLQPSKSIDFHRYGKEGVAALAEATPVDSGETANSWYYEIEEKDGMVSINFNNSHIQNGVPIAIILQYGHGTGTGGWVEGRDYINPATQKVFDKIADEAWKEVMK